MPALSGYTIIPVCVCGYHSPAGSADTFVQAWLLPQMVFHDCSKASYKTDLKKGTLNPVYYKEVHL